MTKRYFGVLLAAALAFAGPVSAQDATKKLPSSVVNMFNVFCLSHLPDLDGIAKAAGFGEFAEMVGAELEPYHPEVRADTLRGWKFHDAEDEYILVSSKSKPDETFKKAVPAFADSTTYGCSLLIPAKGANPKVLSELSKLLGRAPDDDWDEGAMHVHSWSGQTDKLLTNVYFYAPPDGAPTAVLSANVFVKN